MWEPFPGTSQELALTCPVWEMLYTGTRGPGKTDTLLMDFAREVGAGWGSDWRGVLFRNEYKPLAEVVKKSEKWFHRIFPRAQFLRSAGDFKWVWPDGEELLFRAFKVPSDYWDYHGHEYPWIGWEEITGWPSGECYHVMKSCNRSSRAGIPRRYRATCNPYGPGHNWVKAYFIDPAPAGQPFVADRTNVAAIAAEYGVALAETEPLETVTLHGHYSENRALMEAQPDYPALIAAAAGNPEQARAWLSDDWDIVSGGMFDDLWVRTSQGGRKSQVLPQFEIPKGWRIFRAFDWGSTKPFSVGWWAVANGESALLPTGVFCPPRDSLIRFAEWYGWDGKTPNVGLRMTDTDIGKGIAKRETELGIRARVKPGPADTSIFSSDPGHTSPADAMKAEGVTFTEADKSQGSRKRGWQAMRRMLTEASKPTPEAPGMWVTENCRQFIRTIPTLPRSEKDPDDIDTDAEDHCFHGDTLVDTIGGQVPIRELVGTEGLVLSVGGRWEHYTDCRMTRAAAPVVRVKLEDGRSFVATRDHRMLTGSGAWLMVSDLRAGTVLGAVDQKDLLSCVMVSDRNFGQEVDGASKGHQRDDTGVSGREVLPMRPVLSAERAAAPPRGLGRASRTDSGWVSRTPPNGRRIQESDPGPVSSARSEAHQSAHAQAGAPGAEQGEAGCWQGGGGLAPEREGTGMARRALRRAHPGTLRGTCLQGVRTLRGRIRDGETHSRGREVLLQQVQGGGQAGIRGGQRDPGVRRVPQELHGEPLLKGSHLFPVLREQGAVVRETRIAGTADVFCLRVPGTGAFSIEGGIIVHNCGDETRYALGSRTQDVATFKLRVY